MTAPPTVLFVGGGSGGHIFPNLAVAEKLRQHRPETRAHFLISDRPLDAAIINKTGLPYTPLPVRPLPSWPWFFPAWITRWCRSVCTVKQLISDHDVAAMVVCGGFVSGPAVMAARRHRRRIVMLNLDAVPGQANRYLARKVDHIFTAYDQPNWPNAEPICVPLLSSAVNGIEPSEARKQLGLDPQRPTLLVYGGSQGAKSLNELMAHMVRSRFDFGQWQILHLTGPDRAGDLQNIDDEHEVRARVLPFCDQMGLAWGSAELALARAGAGSVAEAQANAVPTIFLPYPYHHDQHQRLNAQPLVEAGGALIQTDQVDPVANLAKLAPVLRRLMDDPATRTAMADGLRSHRRAGGAETVVRWLID